MSTEPALFPLPHPPHTAWRAALASVRERQRPDAVLQLIWDARQTLSDEQHRLHYPAELTREAIALLTGLPRTGTRLRRLRGHLRRLTAAERAKAAAEKEKAAEARREAELAEYLSPEFAPPPLCGKG